MRFQTRSLLWALGMILLILGASACSPASTPTLLPETVIPNANQDAIPVSTSTPIPTDTPVPPTPTPEPITFANICGHFGQEVVIEGIIHLPDEISCSSSWCTAQLVNFDRSNYMVIGLNRVSGEFDPRNNFMADIPMSYDLSDFRVRSDDGTLLGESDLVQIHGTVRPPIIGDSGAGEIDCSLEDIVKVEAIDQITITGPEKLTRTNLVDAILNGWVIASIAGDGLSQIDISLKPQVDFNLEVELEEGTLFEAQSGGVQNMVLRKGTVVVLKPNIEISLELEVSCANMELHEPTGSDSFVVSQGDIQADLQKLLNLPGFRFETSRIQQFAIWTITDNPPRYGYTGIVGPYDIGDGTPTDEEINRIKTLFNDAGINHVNYQVFQ